MIGLTPDINEAAVIRHGVLHLSFADGLSGEVEVLDRMRGAHGEKWRDGEKCDRVSHCGRCGARRAVSGAAPYEADVRARIEAAGYGIAQVVSCRRP
jgi:hypothetical protein